MSRAKVSRWVRFRMLSSAAVTLGLRQTSVPAIGRSPPSTRIIGAAFDGDVQVGGALANSTSCSAATRSGSALCRSAWRRRLRRLVDATRRPASRCCRCRWSAARGSTPGRARRQAAAPTPARSAVRRRSSASGASVGGGAAGPPRGAGDRVLALPAANGAGAAGGDRRCGRSPLLPRVGDDGAGRSSSGHGSAFGGLAVARLVGARTR